MSLFCDPTDLNAYGRQLAQLLLIGGVQMETLAKGKQQVTFHAWSEAVRKAVVERGMTLEGAQLEWLWEALTTEPRVHRELGAHIRSREDEWKNQQPILVLKSGHL